MVWLIANFLLVLLVKLEYNLFQWKNGKVIPHGKQILVVAVEVGLLTFLVIGFNWRALITGVLQSALWWCLFDLLWNIRRGHVLLFVGSTAPTDRFFRTFKSPETTMLITKVVLLLIVIYLYIVI